MNKDNIYLVCYDSLTSSMVGGMRMYYLKQFFIDKGYRVNLITRLNSDGDNVDIVVKVPFLLRLKIVPSVLNKILIPDSYIIWAFKVFLSLKNIHDFTDPSKLPILITSGPPFGVHWVGLLLKLSGVGFKWIVDLRDPFTFNPGYSQVAPKKKLDQLLERKVLVLADNVVFNTSFDRNTYLRFYNKIGKTIVIRNGFSEKYYTRDIRKSVDRNGFVYSGGTYGDEVPEFLDLLFKKLSKYRISSCSCFGELSEVYEKSEVLRYSGKLHPNEVPIELSKFKYGIVYLPAKFIGSGRIAQKLYDYLGAGLIPIIINATKEMQIILDDVGTGHCLESNINDKSINALVRFLDKKHDITEIECKILKYSREEQFKFLLNDLLIS